jgi:hypothetical protein
MTTIYGCLSDAELIRIIELNYDKRPATPGYSQVAEAAHILARRFEIIQSQRESCEMALKHERARASRMEQALCQALDGFKAALNLYNKEIESTCRNGEKLKGG